MRKTERIFAISLAVSLLFHIVLLGISPKIRLFNQALMRLDAARMFRVKPVELEVRPRPARPPIPRYEEPPTSLDQFLLKERARPELPPVPEYPRQELEEAFGDKVANEPVSREHATEPASTTLEAIELEVVAVHKKLTGEKIDVTRRLIPEKVRRVLPSEVMPTISGPGGGGVPLELARTLPAAPPVVTVQERPPEPTEVLRGAKEHELPPLASEIVSAPSEQFPLREKREQVQKYPSLDDVLEIRLVTYEPPGEKGYFLIRISPKRGGTIETMPKQVVFVIDASKSIREAKLEQSKLGLERCLMELNARDRFNVVAFKDSPTFFSEEFVSPTPDRVNEARAFIKKLAPSGETDMYNAMAPLVQIKEPATHPYNVVLISDGKPTSGMVDSRAIINNITRQNQLNASIYTFAGGTEVNVYLLDLLAYLNKGHSHVAKQIYDIDGEMPAFYRAIKDPILMDLRANYANIDESEIYPKVLPDFYLGSEILVSGRYGETTVFSMRLTGTVNGQKKELVFKREFAQAEKGGNEIARLWAFKKIYKLIADVCQEGSKPELIREINALSQRYGIATAYSPTGR